MIIEDYSKFAANETSAEKKFRRRVALIAGIGLLAFGVMAKTARAKPFTHLSSGRNLLFRQGNKDGTSNEPTDSPSLRPTPNPTMQPTDMPTAAPSPAPTPSPTAGPTTQPTDMPTAAPSPAPTPSPTAGPTVQPTDMPTAAPSPAPTPSPTMQPTDMPTSPSGPMWILAAASQSCTNACTESGGSCNQLALREVNNETRVRYVAGTLLKLQLTLAYGCTSDFGCQHTASTPYFNIQTSPTSGHGAWDRDGAADCDAVSSDVKNLRICCCGTMEQCPIAAS